MYKLENYLDNIKNNKIQISIYSTYKYFGYTDEQLFRIDLDIILKTIYTHIKVVQEKEKRIEQCDFRRKLIKLYGKCVVTDNDCEEEFEACHIIPIKDDGCYNLDNGLILEKNIHGTFDKYYWSINPDTLEIEINDSSKVNTINKYKGNKIKIIMNPFLYNNLYTHYNKFKKINNLYMI